MEITIKNLLTAALILATAAKEEVLSNEYLERKEDALDGININLMEVCYAISQGPFKNKTELSAAIWAHCHIVNQLAWSLEESYVQDR